MSPNTPTLTPPASPEAFNQEASLTHIKLLIKGRQALSRLDVYWNWRACFHIRWCGMLAYYGGTNQSED